MGVQRAHNGRMNAVASRAGRLGRQASSHLGRPDPAGDAPDGFQPVVQVGAVALAYQRKNRGCWGGSKTRAA